MTSSSRAAIAMEPPKLQRVAILPRARGTFRVLGLDQYGEVRKAPKAAIRSPWGRGKKLAVISHERSGTHFLMNALGLNFDYIAEPWWNFDSELGLDFDSPRALRRYFEAFHDVRVPHILKSHHPIEFFSDFIDYFAEQFRLFYVYRDPRETLASNWQLMRRMPWDEGPKPDSFSEYLRAMPRGRMARYQKRLEPDMLGRWKTHVTGWLDWAEENPGKAFAVDYRELDADFEGAMRRAGEWLGEPRPRRFRRPGKERNVISEKIWVGSRAEGSARARADERRLSEADQRYVRRRVGGVMSRLGCA